MKAVFLAIFICAMVFVSGCAQLQAKIEADVAPATIADLTNAAAISTAGGDEDGALCANELAAYMKTWPTAPAPTPTSVDVSKTPAGGGVASAIAQLRLAEMAAENAQSYNFQLPPIDKQTVKDCLFVLNDTLTQANIIMAKFGIKAAAVVGGLKGPVIVKAIRAAPIPIR